MGGRNSKYMKKIVAFALIWILSIMLTGVALAVSKGTINTDTARIRKEASTESAIIALASIDEKVEIIEESGDWYKVNYKDKTGYVSKELVDEDGNIQKTKDEKVEKEENEPAKEENKEEESTKENSEAIKEENATEKEEIVEIKEKYKGKIAVDLTLKILPTINSRDFEKVEKGSEINVIEILNDWCYVETAEKIGWLRIEALRSAIATEETSQENENNEAQDVKNEEESQNEQPEETKEQEPATKEEEKVETPKTTTQKVGYVNVDVVNLREKTSTSSDVIDTLSINTEVTVVGEEDNWYKVEVKGMKGYIASKYISDEKVPEVTSRAADATRESKKNTSEEEKVEEQKAEAETKDEEPSATETSNTDLGAQIVAYAKQYLGYKYVAAGASPSTGFDCSGFTSYVYGHFGISISRASTAQAGCGKHIAKSDLKVGDLLIFNNRANSGVGHVGIYIGGNKFIHASNPSDGVKITSLSDSYYTARYVDARRLF